MPTRRILTMLIASTLILMTTACGAGSGTLADRGLDGVPIEPGTIVTSPAAPTQAAAPTTAAAARNDHQCHVTWPHPPANYAGKILVVGGLWCDTVNQSSLFTVVLQYKTPGGWTDGGSVEKSIQSPPTMDAIALPLTAEAPCADKFWQGYATWDVAFPGQKLHSKGSSQSPAVEIKC